MLAAIGLEGTAAAVQLQASERKAIPPGGAMLPRPPREVTARQVSGPTQNATASHSGGTNPGLPIFRYF